MEGKIPWVDVCSWLVTLPWLFIHASRRSSHYHPPSLKTSACAVVKRINCDFFDLCKDLARFKGQRFVRLCWWKPREESTWRPTRLPTAISGTSTSGTTTRTRFFRMVLCSWTTVLLNTWWLTWLRNLWVAWIYSTFCKDVAWYRSSRIYAINRGGVLKEFSQFLQFISLSGIPLSAWEWILVAGLCYAY